jgi:hypothetical protein
MELYRYTSPIISLSRQRPVLIAALLLALTASGCVVSSRADYTISISQSDVSVYISGVFAQGVPNSSANNTADIFAKIPVFHAVFQNDNATGLTRQLNDALAAKSAAVQASQLSLIVASNGTRLNYNMTFIVHGAVSFKGAFEKVDLAWRSFKIADEVSVGTISLNKVFPTYLQSQIQDFASQGGGSQVGGQLFWYFNNRRITFTLIPVVTKGLLLFDFQSLVTPLEGWDRTNDVQRGLMTLRANAGFNVTLIQQVSELEETTNFANDAIYTVTAVIHAPLTTIPSGNLLSFEGPGAPLQYELMAAIPIGLLGVFLVSFIMERRYSIRRPRPGKGAKGTKRRPC